jgi:hypothetical protein
MSGWNAWFPWLPPSERNSEPVPWRTSSGIKLTSSGTPPRLIEPGVSYFFNQTLRQCHVFRMRYWQWVTNLTAIAVGVVVLGGILWWKRRQRPTPEKLAERHEQRRAYIVNRIRAFPPTAPPFVPRWSPEDQYALPSWAVTST